MLFSLSTITATAATIANTNKYKLVSVPNKDNCVDFGTFCINGSTAYALKTEMTDTSTSKSALYKITNFADSSKATIASTKVISNLGHGNGMAYYDGYLWVATSTDEVVKMTTSGEIKKRYKTPDGVKVSGITYCRGGKFIVSVGNKINGAYTTFKTAEIDETNKTLIYKKTFKIKAPTLKDTYDRVTPQDHFYNSTDKCLYMVYSQRKIGDSNSRYNFVFKVNLSDTIVDGQTYTPTKKFRIHAGSSNTTLFEAESWAMVGTTKYCCFNIKTNGKSADAIYKITNAN
ncbi:hypothetical protein LI177_02580 [bacterium 210820-DFI.6.37]|nr:hypothetical protein [bacterium 210820-DFI.6.37]